MPFDYVLVPEVCKCCYPAGSIMLSVLASQTVILAGNRAEILGERCWGESFSGLWTTVCVYVSTHKQYVKHMQCQETISTARGSSHPPGFSECRRQRARDTKPACSKITLMCSMVVTPCNLARVFRSNV